MNEVTPEQLKARIDAGDGVFVLDVRNPHEADICRIPGSTLVPLVDLPGRVMDVPADRDVVVHCKSGGRSAKAVAYLQSLGFTRVANLSGGILAWADRIDPTMTKY